MSPGGESSIGATAAPSAAAGVAEPVAGAAAGAAPAAGAGALGCASATPDARNTTLETEIRRRMCRRYTGIFAAARLAVADPPRRPGPRRTRGIDRRTLVAERQR